MKMIFNRAIEAVIPDKWVPVTEAWRVLRLWTEERPPIWTVVANVLEKKSRRQPKMGSPPAWRLTDVLRTPNRKTGLDTKRIHVPRAWTDPLVRPRQWKRDIRFGTWNIRRG
jgi:hypothetical protein